METVEMLEHLPPVKLLSQLDQQVFLMNFPLTMSTRVANNAQMVEALDIEHGLELNRPRAFKQFLDLYSFVTQQNALVYILPSSGDFQDLEYVANMGLYLPHVEHPTIVAANFTSPCRQGEEIIGIEFFEMMGYDVRWCPYRWEGEAELKYIRDNLYIGGYGIRSTLKAHQWMAREFDMEIPTVFMSDPRMYHLDTMFLRLTPEKVMFPTDIMMKEDIKQLEKYVEVIHVPTDVMLTGAFNAVKCGNYLIFADAFNVLDPFPTETLDELDKYLSIAESATGLTLKSFNLLEYRRSGASLGCMFMHMNYRKY